MRARQAGGARAGVALDHEPKIFDGDLLQPLRGGRREGLAEQRLEILRPRQALLGLEVDRAGRSAPRSSEPPAPPSADAFAAAPSAAHSPRGEWSSRGEGRDGLGRSSSSSPAVRSCSGAYSSELWSDPTVVPPVRPRLAEVLRPLVGTGGGGRRPIATPQPPGPTRDAVEINPAPATDRERNFDTGARPVRSARCARSDFVVRRVGACVRAHRPPRVVSAAGLDEST